MDSQTEPDDDVSFKQKFSKDLNTGGRSHFQHQTIIKVGGLGFPHYRLVSICLGLLNTAMLVVALVLGIYCAKAKDFQQISNEALTPLIIERNFLLNHTDVIKDRLDAQVALENQRKTNVQLQMQVKQQETITDSLMSQIVTLRVEKANLESSKTELESSCGWCPLGWIFLRSSCYYYSVPEPDLKKNWSDSRADCIGRGGDLLVINNLEEQKAINNNCPKTPGTGTWWQTGFWIGLTDTVTNGLWVWVNNVTEENTMYWQTNQPDLNVNLRGHCAAFARNILTWRSWYNRNCQSDKLNWICEMEPAKVDMSRS